MKAIKKINNNFALCLDEKKKEVVIYGKGIGFGTFPYEVGLDRIERIFYDVNPKCVGIFTDVPQTIILTCSDIIDKAQIELNCYLNPNLIFTLADHINYAIDRIRKGIDISTPLTYDFKYLYPKETKIGKFGLAIIEKNLNVRLPNCEAASIAMHLINAEGSDLHASMKKLRMIEDICTIVENDFNIKLNKESYSYSRFAVHLHNLIHRISNGQQIESIPSSMLKSMAKLYPKAYACADKIVNYLTYQWNSKYNDEEVLYLMTHIDRIRC